MIVVNRQPALLATTASVPFEDATDCAPTVLPVEKSLVLLGSGSLPAKLGFVVQLVQTVPATVLAATVEGRKLVQGLLSPTPLATGHTFPNTLVSDLMESSPDQVASHGLKTDTRPSGHFAQGETSSE
jgi:hypothetical protein